MTKHALTALSLLAAVACTTAPQKKPEWKVKATTESQQKIWVVKDDGSRQCQPKVRVLSPQGAQLQLQRAGVIVFQAQAGSDGQMHAQRCGAPTGGVVAAEISRVDLNKALALGYVTRSSPGESQGE